MLSNIHLEITTPNTTPLFHVEDMKQFMRVDFDDDDELIKQLINTAEQHVEKYLSRTLLTKTYTLHWSYDQNARNQPLDYFVVKLPMGPVTSIVKVYDCDRCDDLKRISFELGMSDSVVMFARCHERVDIHFTAGFGDTPDDVPMDIRQATMMIVAELYRKRDSVRPGDWKAYMHDLLHCHLPKRVK